MKKSVIKRVLCFVFAISLLGGFAFSASAETIQDRIQAWQAERNNNNNNNSNSGDNSQGSSSGSVMDEAQFSEQVKELWDQISGTDIGSVISEFDLQKLFDMGSEAWKSAVDMIKDAIGGGSGTSSSDNTGTKQSTTARAAASTYVITYDTVPAVTNSNTTSAAPETTTSPSTYAVTAPQVTQKTESVTYAAADEKSLSTASIIVIVILSIATIGVIVALVVYFSVKRR